MYQVQKSYTYIFSDIGVLRNVERIDILTEIQLSVKNDHLQPSGKN